MANRIYVTPDGHRIHQDFVRWTRMLPQREPEFSASPPLRFDVGERCIELHLLDGSIEFSQVVEEW